MTESLAYVGFIRADLWPTRFGTIELVCRRDNRAECLQISPRSKSTLDEDIPPLSYASLDDQDYLHADNVMRLQVSVRRHALPATNIIFTTGTGPLSKTLAPNSTVTDFLYDVNDLVPLESADGEWGLEDYVVEVQTTADQETYYECLHYQTIGSVLREDDEVIIRCLGTEDLRSRRLGGRHQISADGRHLIDGVAFGRQWLRKAGRPGINIPPRKRRRLEIEGDDEELDEESTTLLEQLKELGYSNEDLDEDEEDDEDFVADVDGEEPDEASDEDEDEQPLRIKASADFDDADANMDEDEGEDSGEDSDSDEEEGMAAAGLELSDELKALLIEAEQLSENDTYRRLPSEAAQSPRKRKRDDASEDDQVAEDASEFEGFVTPTKPSLSIPAPMSSVSSVSMSDDTTVPSDSESDSDRDIAAGLEDTSSSGSSDSGQTSSSESSDSDSEDDTSSSDSTSDSSSDGSTKPKQTNLPSSSPAKQTSSQVRSSSTSSISSPSASAISPSKRKQAPPGQGLKITQKNNRRTQKRRRLRELKREGILHLDANFADMIAFDIYNNGNYIPDGESQIELQDDFESKKAALLEQLHVESEIIEEKSKGASKELNTLSAIVGIRMEEPATETETTTVDKDPSAGPPVFDVRAKDSVIEQEIHKENRPAGDTMEVDEIVPFQEIGAKAQESFIGKATPKSTEKRAKLDLASSRRMLFNSLGLRNPKTPEAEQALREKLAKDIKRIPQRKSEERVNEQVQLKDTADDDMDSWKDKIVLSAVECEYEGVSLSIPPFPFKQGWDSNATMRRGANKKKGRKQLKHYDGGEDYVQEYAPDVSNLQTPSQDTPPGQTDRPDSRTLSFEGQEADEMPRPSEFQSFPNLLKADVAPGAVVAFKELHIHKFQPVVSDYRIARVRAVQTEGSAEVIELMLSRKDWPAESTEPNPFAMEDEDTQPEDGLRIKTFADLLEPKLVEASSIQVNAIPAEVVEKDTSTNLPQAQSSVVPEFAEAVQDSEVPILPRSKVLQMTHVEVNTPRRNEITAIIKEAGFDSAIDKDLLQPEDELEPGPQSSPAFHTRSHHSQPLSLSPALINVNAVATSLTGPRYDSAGLSGWDSSPLRQIQADSSLIEPSQPSLQPTLSKSRLGTQSSIPYPALSQLDIDASGVTVTNESSFQDAQRVSTPPDIDTSALRPELDTSKLHPEYPYDDYGNDETQASLASEAPQTQTPCPSSQVKPAGTSAKSSFLGHGLDGQASSDEESDYHSDDSSLRSLRELTSSQNNKIQHACRRAGVSPPVPRVSNATISPPSVKDNRLSNCKKYSTSPEQSEGDDGVELLPAKVSQSQALRLSQIPAGSQIVDLTFSSSPQKSDSDGDYPASRTRGAKAKRTTKSRHTRGQSTGSVSFDDGEEEDAHAGIGKRRFLTTKKWSSRSHV